VEGWQSPSAHPRLGREVLSLRPRRQENTQKIRGVVPKYRSKPLPLCNSRQQVRHACGMTWLDAEIGPAIPHSSHQAWHTRVHPLPPPNRRATGLAPSRQAEPWCAVDDPALREGLPPASIGSWMTRDSGFRSVAIFWFKWQAADRLLLRMTALWSDRPEIISKTIIFFTRVP